MTSDDIVGADAMLRAAFGVDAGLARRLVRYFAIEPSGWLIDVDDADGVRGTVGAVVYDVVAYVGLMGVQPALQSRGLGRALLVQLLALLEARGVTCATLDATDAGAPLYESLGFVDAGVTHELVADASGTAAETPLSDDDARAIRILDAALFGAPRDRLWDRLLDERRGHVHVHHAADGAVDGYLCALPEALGPWGARSPDVAHDLLRRALAAGATPRVLVPGDNADALALVRDAGFTPKRTLRHMRRGLAPALRWGAIYGKGSYCVG